MNAAALTPRPDPGLSARLDLRAIRRLFAGAPLAAVITLALAVLMQTLVANRDAPPTTPSERPNIVIASEITDTPPRMRVRPDPPTDVVAPPPVTLSDPDRDTPSTLPPIPVDPPVLEPTGPDTTSGRILAAPRRIFTPIPLYPTNMRGREGSCTVAFDVNAAGGTEKVRALSCTHNGFKRAAEDAVARSVYSPAQGELGPVEVTGLSMVIEFRMED